MQFRRSHTLPSSRAHSARRCRPCDYVFAGGYAIEIHCLERARIDEHDTHSLCIPVRACIDCLHSAPSYHRQLECTRTSARSFLSDDCLIVVVPLSRPLLHRTPYEWRSGSLPLAPLPAQARHSSATNFCTIFVPTSHFYSVLGESFEGDQCPIFFLDNVHSVPDLIEKFLCDVNKITRLTFFYRRSITHFSE